MNDAPPEVFDGKYRVVKELGRGGFGVVYLGHDDKLDRKVAIKVMIPSAEAREGFAARFMREARILAQLDHPAIVPIYSFGEQDGAAFFVMKFLEGSNLDYELHAKGLSVPALVRTLQPIADALDHAHDQGIVHRDLKPENIRFGPDGRPMLLDFGIARDEQNSALTAEGTTLGTPFYMAPEQAKGKTPDRRSDIYALGTILFELITGERPFSGPTPMSVMFQHVHDAPPSIMQLRPELPPAAEAVLQRAMAKDPALRYQRCGELFLDLQHALGMTGSLPAVPAEGFDDTFAGPAVGDVTSPEPVIDSIATTRAEVAEPSEAAVTMPVPVAQRRSPVAVVGILAVLGLGGGVAAWALGGAEDPEPPPPAPAATAAPTPPPEPATEPPTEPPAEPAPAQPTVARTAAPPGPDAAAAPPAPAAPVEKKPPPPRKRKRGRIKL